MTNNIESQELTFHVITLYASFIFIKTAYFSGLIYHRKLNNNIFLLPAALSTGNINFTITGFRKLNVSCISNLPFRFSSRFVCRLYLKYLYE